MKTLGVLLKTEWQSSFCAVFLLWFTASPLFAQGSPFGFADDFARRGFIQTSPLVTSFAIAGSLSNATMEASEPGIEGVSSGQTVWGTWTAPSNGIVALSAESLTFSPLITIYTGNELANLSLFSSNNYLICYEDEDCGCHWRERQQISFHVTGGQAYQVCVDSAVITDASIQFQVPPAGGFSPWGPVFTTNVPAGGDFILYWQFTAAPHNDDFSNPQRLSGSRISLLASNAGGTKEPGEPDHLGNPGGSSVWYSWTAPASGRVTLSTNEIPPYAPPSSYGEGSEGTTTGYLPAVMKLIKPAPCLLSYFAAYTGTAVDALTPADNLLMSLDAYPNAVEFDAVKGDIYHIAFDGNQGTTGEIPLYLALTAPASNDSFNRRIQLRGLSVVAKGYNAGAVYQSGAPRVAGSTGKTAWWSWTAPVSGPVSLDLTGSDYAFPVAVFTGSSISNLQTIVEGAGDFPLMPNEA